MISGGQEILHGLVLAIGLATVLATVLAIVLATVPGIVLCQPLPENKNPAGGLG